MTRMRLVIVVEYDVADVPDEREEWALRGCTDFTYGARRARTEGATATARLERAPRGRAPRRPVIDPSR